MKKYINHLLVVAAIAAMPVLASAYTNARKEADRRLLIDFIEYCQKNKGLEQIDPNKDYKKSSLHDLKNIATYYVEQSCFYDVTDFDEQYKIDEIVYHNDKNKEHGNNN